MMVPSQCDLLKITSSSSSSFDPKKKKKGSLPTLWKKGGYNRHARHMGFLNKLVDPIVPKLPVEDPRVILLNQGRPAGPQLIRSRTRPHSHYCTCRIRIRKNPDRIKWRALALHKFTDLDHFNRMEIRIRIRGSKDLTSLPFSTYCSSWTC